MIYEHQFREGRVYIEWNQALAWGNDNENKWLCTYRGHTLAKGPTPEIVLDAVLCGSADAMPLGLSVDALRLPPSLAAWRSSRD